MPKSLINSTSNIPWRERPLLPLKIAAELVGVSRASLYRLEAEGKLSFSRIGGTTLVKTETLIRLIDDAKDWSPSEHGAAGRAASRQRAKDAWK